LNCASNSTAKTRQKRNSPRVLSCFDELSMIGV
jgi:hypothetical protein